MSATLADATANQAGHISRKGGFRAFANAEDAGVGVLADVPLDVRPFDVGPGALLRKTRVEGCIVTSPSIGMLVSAPAFANAARYRFTRPGDAGEAGERALGVVDAATVRALAGGGR